MRTLSMATKQSDGVSVQRERLIPSSLFNLWTGLHWATMYNQTGWNLSYCIQYIPFIMLQFCTYLSFRKLALCAYQYLYLTHNLLRQKCCLEKRMGTASYCIRKEPNRFICAGNLFRQTVPTEEDKKKKDAFSVVERWNTKGVNAASGTGGGATSLPPPALLSEVQVTLLNESQNWLTEKPLIGYQRILS